MKTGASLNRGGSRQDYETPWSFIHACEKKFGKIVFDLAASKENKKAPFFSTEVDSLTQEWHALPFDKWYQWLWLNPPFGDITAWARKCAEEKQKGARILFLVPASIGSNWFRDYVAPEATVHALNGRITFVGADDPYPKDLMLCVFDGTHRKKEKGEYWPIDFHIWTWMNELMSDPLF